MNLMIDEKRISVFTAFAPDRSNASTSIAIDDLSITDTARYAGIEDEVDGHTERLIQGIEFATPLDVIVEFPAV